MYLATSSPEFGFQIRLYTADSFEFVSSLSGHSASINCLSFNSSGTMLVSGSTDRTVRVWDMTAFSELHIFNLDDSAVLSVSFLRDTGDGACACESMDHIVLWRCKNGSVRGWNMRTDSQHFHKQLTDADAWRGQICASIDGSLLFTRTQKTHLTVFDAVSAAEVLSVPGAHSSAISTIAVSPCGEAIATGSSDRCINIWNVKNGGGDTLPSSGALSDADSEPGAYTPIACGNGLTVRCTLEGHNDTVMCLCFNFNGTRLVSGGLDFVVNIWDTVLGNCLHSIDCGTLVDSVCFSCVDSRCVAVGQRGLGLRVFDCEIMEELCRLPDAGSKACFAQPAMILL